MYMVRTPKNTMNKVPANKRVYFICILKVSTRPRTGNPKFFDTCNFKGYTAVNALLR